MAANSAGEAKLDNRFLADLLMEQYKALKQDMIFQMGSYKNHVRNNQIIGSAIIAAGSALISTGNLTITDQNKYLWIVAVLFVVAVSYYLIYDVFESVFAVKALEQYLCYLEDRINSLTGHTLLVWQSHVAKQLWPLSKSLKIKAPIPYLQFFQSVLIAVSTLFFPIFTCVYIVAIAKIDVLLLASIAAVFIFLIYSVVSVARVWKDTNARVHVEVQSLISRAADQGAPNT